MIRINVTFILLGQSWNTSFMLDKEKVDNFGVMAQLNPVIRELQAVDPDVTVYRYTVNYNRIY